MASEGGSHGGFGGASQGVTLCVHSGGHPWVPLAVSLRRLGCRCPERRLTGREKGGKTGGKWVGQHQNQWARRVNGWEGRWVTYPTAAVCLAVTYSHFCAGKFPGKIPGFSRAKIRGCALSRGTGMVLACLFHPLEGGMDWPARGPASLRQT